MRLTFQLRFHTRPSQAIWLTGSDEFLRALGCAQPIPLHYIDEQLWAVSLGWSNPAKPVNAKAPSGQSREEDRGPNAKAPSRQSREENCGLNATAQRTQRRKEHLGAGGVSRGTRLTGYRYLLEEADGSRTEDWGQVRSLDLSALPVEELLIIDSWNPPGSVENAFHTEPFQKVLLKPNQTEYRGASVPKPTHLFRVQAPLLVKGQTLCMVGTGPALRHWDTSNPLLLNRIPQDMDLTIELDLSHASFPIEYKYGVYDLERQRFVRYEDGTNRILADVVHPGKRTIVNDGFARLPASGWKGAGVSVPVFSLRSERSFGVGEFSDLKRLADWCAQTGLKLIQILPVNDTTATHTWMDSYPYAAISAFALHPLYLNLNDLAQGESKRVFEALEPERKRLNSLAAVDYEAVMAAKIQFLKQVYPLEKRATFHSEGFRRFFEQNNDWLPPYAFFCHLRDEYGTSDFSKWPAHGHYHEKEAATLAQPGSETYESIAFYYWVQYHLHRQLADAARYAHERGVILKGDIPIGVYRYGADAWQAPKLYRMEMQAGAPPDAFAIKGQNWGFPTYNWPRMKATGFAWWKRRFEQMSRYFDAFRIDHILGFFRIWSVPVHAVEGIMGYFVPALPVRSSEFVARGVAFNRDRLVQPYLTDSVLNQIFGPEAELVKPRFLDSKGPGRYAFKPEFASQCQVEAHFAGLEPTDRNARLREGLFDLISNVILFQAHDRPDAFHFRFAIEQTTSFQDLDSPTRTRVWDLYLDYFFRRQEDFWKKEALEKLPALKRATNLLVCGEDLGLVPACVPEVMRGLGLLGLEIQRMPKELHREFSRPGEAPYLSVVAPSTHDMSTIRAWWKENRATTQRFYNQELGKSGTAPEECEPWVSREIINQHLASSAIWSIFQLQDLLGLDERLRHPSPESERINVPANPRNYWRYRMHLSLESLLGAASFNQELVKLVTSNGR